jgi:outer membrane receptor protein involved in Fe transport
MKIQNFISQTILMFVCSSYIYATSNINGTVKTVSTNKNIEMVAVAISELNKWTVTDENGKFVFKNIPKGTYTLYAQCLGFQKNTKTIIVDSLSQINIQINLKESSLELEEVVVTAKEGQGLSTTTKIGKSALNHIQASSLNDVMQLMPGAITEKIDLTKVQQIKIREIDDSDNGSMGTAIIIDGAQLTNNADLQIKKGLNANANSVSGKGIDLREIPTDNIESIEVIRGIPSAQYGDLTSGAVIINTKAGKEDIEIRAKVDPKIKQIAISTGLDLGKGNGFLNLSGDYLSTVSSLIKSFDNYKRFTFSSLYSNVFYKASQYPLSFNGKITYSQNVDGVTNDPAFKNEESITTNKSIRFNSYGKWMLNPINTEIRYNMLISYKNQEEYNKDVVTNPAGSAPLYNSYESKTYLTEYLPVEYITESWVKGEPININAQLSLKKLNKLDAKHYNSFSVGVSWRTDVNIGDGYIFDSRRPPVVSNYRPRNFDKIPALNQFNSFVEDKISFDIFNRKLDLQFGLRLNVTQPSKERFISLEPRFNMSYQIMDKLKLNFGVGKTSKAPPLVYLYPTDTYFDYHNINKAPEIVVATTKSTKDLNLKPDLKLTTNNKFELGLKSEFYNTKISINTYYEDLKNGYAYTRNPFLFDYRKFDVENLPSGKKYFFDNGQIYYEDEDGKHNVQHKQDTLLKTFSYPTNSISLTKKGIEYSINFPKIKKLYTKFSLSGAYMYTKSVETKPRLVSYQNFTGAQNNYIAEYLGGRGYEKSRFNTNLRTIVHIPKLDLIFTINTQLVWFDKSKALINPEGIFINKDGERIFGSEAVNSTEYNKLKIPSHYYDESLTRHEFKKSDIDNPNLSIMVISGGTKLYYKENTKPFHCQINLKLSKDIMSTMRLSFFVNNILNHRPKYKITNTYDSYSILNTPIYFGAELKIKI